MDTYVITLAETFPTKHPRKGQPTGFCNKVLEAVWRAHNMIIRASREGMKLHTFRGNYDLWAKRFKKIDAGKACLSIRKWSGKPYHSKQIEICKLTAKDGISLQKIFMMDITLGTCEFDKPGGHFYCANSDQEYSADVIAANDGLTIIDWLPFFYKFDFSKPMACIQFTNFRY